MPARALLLVILGAVAAAVLVTIHPVFLLPDLQPPGFRADILVVGGSPAGVTAAIAAARQGMVVVLTEPRPYLGTVWTASMLNMLDLSRHQANRHLIKGIFLEILQEIGGITFDPRHARHVLRAKMEAEPGITLLLNTHLLRALVDGQRLLGAEVLLPDGSGVAITAPVTIDATDDGDLAAAAGVPFTYGREATGIDRRAMPATLMFRLADVDWAVAVRYARAHRRGRHPSGAYQGYAWGFREVMRDYSPADPVLSAHDMNIGRLPDETVLINSLQVHEVDGTDVTSRLRGYARAQREIPNLVEYLRRRGPGFSRARLVEVAPELYIRETRHLLGLYLLTASDIASRARFWDRVGAASYPIDLHQYVKGEQYPFRPVRNPYTIPLRSLVTARIDGLFVASRAFSATHEAAASARVVPTTMAMGEGVGVAAAVAVPHRVTPHEMAERRHLVTEVQRRLVSVGAAIDY